MKLPYLFKNIFIILLVFAISGIAGVSFAQTEQDIAKKRKETRAKINRLKILENQEANKMYRNQQKLEKNEKELKTSKKKYDDAKNRLDNLEYKLSVAKTQYSRGEAAAKYRIRQIYMKDRTGLFILILSAENLNSFIDRIHYQNIIAKKDKQQLDAVRDKAKQIARLRSQVENEKRILATSIDDMNYRKKQIKSALNANANMIYKLQHDRATYERTERELARQSQIIAGIISKSTKNSMVSSATGAFIRPCSGRVTSEFGYRVHPIFRTTKYHSGIDIAAPMGTPIRAANSGKVIFVGWQNGYGKTVIIDHGRVNGKPTSTLYAHQSRYAVSNNQTVTKGQIIGYVGSTGYSTGPHCHFEVRVNGKPVSPWNYI